MCCSIIKRIFLTLIVLGFFTIAWGQPKQIDVDFKVIEESYRTGYPDVLQEIQTACAGKIASRLQFHLPFIRFSAEQGSIKLLCTLDKQNTGADRYIYQVDLTMQITLLDGRKSKLISHKFRAEEDFDEPIPAEPAGFIQELESELDSWLEEEKGKIIEDIFSKISLGETAFPDRTNKAWVMPFSQESHKIGKDSEFVILSKLNSTEYRYELPYHVTARGSTTRTATSYPAEYRGNIIALLNSGENDLDKIDKVQVIGIYLMKFIKAGEETLTPDPTDL